METWEEDDKELIEIRRALGWHMRLPDDRNVLDGETDTQDAKSKKRTDKEIYAKYR